MVENEMGLSAFWLSDLIKDDAHVSIFINTKESCCLCWGFVIELVTENIQTYAINCPLDIAKGFTKALVAIISAKPNTFDPFFDKAVGMLFT